MNVIHAEVVEIARERARSVWGLRSILASMMGTGTTSGSNGADQVMIHGFGFRYVEEIERLEVRKNSLANRRASITHEDLQSALHATEHAILAQLGLELLNTATTDHQQAAAAAPAPAPEIEGLKRVWITKQSSSSNNNNNNNCGGQQGGGDVCAICHEEWKIGDDVRSVVGCSHAYHYNCISKWIKRKPTCPMCRYEIPTNTNNNKRRRRTL